MKTVKILVSFLLICTLLCACGSDKAHANKTYTCENLTITIPGNFQENKTVLEGTGFSFCVARDDIFIVGLRENAEAFGELTLMDYAQLMVEANDLEAEPQDMGDYALLQYSVSFGPKYTYLACIYKNGNEFWTLQGFTFASDFEKNKDTILNILTSAQIQ